MPPNTAVKESTTNAARMLNGPASRQNGEQPAFFTMPSMASTMPCRAWRPITASVTISGKVTISRQARYSKINKPPPWILAR